MSTIALNAAVTGLKAAQLALNTISTNIANASTPGYTRKILPQETLLVGGTGVGVATGTLFRNVDNSLMKDLFKSISTVQSTTVQQDYMGRIQDFHGASESTRAISTKIANLQASFGALATTPDDVLTQNQTVQAARDVANTFNQYTQMITNMRNQADDQISTYVTQANLDLKSIADFNRKINDLTAAGASTADIEDQRDQAVRDLSQYMEISYYMADNNKMVVMTKQGQTLADDSARQIVFQNNILTATSYYPSSDVSGLFIDSVNGIEITGTKIGGSIGALLELRDTTLPTYQAQMDELAQKMSERFDKLGLRLFTDKNGGIPASSDPPAPVGYVGYAGQIQVNPNIIANPDLLRTGTTGVPSLPGSSEVADRINDYAFGSVLMQQATGSVDISSGDIFTAAGLTPTNRVTGNININNYTPSLDNAPNLGPLLPASFSLDIGGTAQTITVNAGDTAGDLVNTINGFFPGAASINALGQLTIGANADIQITDIDMTTDGLADLGLTAGTYPASNPSFTVQVGHQSAVTIEIEPTDTQAELLAKLNAVPGLTASLGPGGVLQIVPDDGGALTLSNVTGTPLNALGISVTDVPHEAFRQTDLGPGGTLSSGLLSNSTITDYARSIISAQAEDYNTAKNATDQEQSYLSVLDQRNSDGSGVDIDRELSDLIRIQTAYGASARIITVTEQMLDDLMTSIVP
jgi:flagellar hook-associated protein 1 FlgK